MSNIAQPYYTGPAPQVIVEEDPKELSKIIAKRLRKADHRYFAGDNISTYIIKGELDQLENEVTKKFEDVLRSLVIDVDRDPNSKNTARRLAKSFIHELMHGRYYPKPDVTSFPNEGTTKYTGMIVVRAEIKSLCAHHWQPITGTCFIGIIPNGEVIGLSKYVRLAQHCARRGTLQEELTIQISDAIKDATKTSDVGVHLSCEHGCLTCRGVEAHSSLTQTTILSGEFDQLDVKNEFFQNIQMQMQGK